jgi:hypothetical protein
MRPGVHRGYNAPLWAGEILSTDSEPDRWPYLIGLRLRTRRPARDLGVPLVTADRKVLDQFSDVAVPLDGFVRQ